MRSKRQVQGKWEIKATCIGSKWEVKGNYKENSNSKETARKMGSSRKR